MVYLSVHTVTHPSTSRARRSATTLVDIMCYLLLSQTATLMPVQAKIMQRKLIDKSLVYFDYKKFRRKNSVADECLPPQLPITQRI